MCGTVTSLTSCLVFFLVLLLQQSQGALITRTYDFSAIFHPNDPVPLVEGSVTVSFDNEGGDKYNVTSGVTLQSINLSLSEVTGYNYRQTLDEMRIGGATGTGVLGLAANDFYLFFSPASGTPSFHQLNYKQDGIGPKRSTTGTISIAIPEPSTCTLALTGLFLPFRRRRSLDRVTSTFEPSRGPP